MLQAARCRKQRITLIGRFLSTRPVMRDSDQLQIVDLSEMAHLRNYLFL
jgi:hypothetical protein